MENTTKLSAIIRYYADKSNSAFLDFREFCSHLKKYAEVNLKTQPDLVKYLDNTVSTVTAELQGLAEKHIATVVTSSNKKKTIISLSFLARMYSDKYNEILNRCNIPYPIAENLPKKIPIEALEIRHAADYITEIIDEEEKLENNANLSIPKRQILYIIDFNSNVPSLLLPETVPVKTILNTAQQKIRKILKKEEYHDYFLKKLRSTNPTKEISIRNFYSSFIDNDDFVYTDFSDGDAYYLWNQTLFYIRQDFEKIQDKTLEDINALQACLILEIQSSYLKEKIQIRQKKEEALGCLEATLSKAPFFYSMPQILKFHDNSGRLLYGRYTEEDLKEFLTKETTEEGPNKLPALLVFKVASGTKYYIYKKNIAQVIVRLCDEAHVSIEKYLDDKWYKCLLEFKKLPEMTDIDKFEDKLHELVEKRSPVLHAILTANFLTLFISENQDSSCSHLFPNGHLQHYRDLLLLYNERIYSNAKNKLPLYYNIPVISWIMKLFMFLSSKQSEKKAQEQEKTFESYTSKTTDSSVANKATRVSKEAGFASKAKSIAKELIPEGSDLNRELDYLIKQWNMMLTKDAYNNLVNDVNNLIRDYIRRVMRTISVNTFSKQRVDELANNLINTPNMKKISDVKALKEYVVLYILKLVSNY